MGLVIRPAGEADEAALRSLHDWLRLEPRLTANADIAFGPTETDPDALGSNLPEYLTLTPLALGALEATELVTKFNGWIKGRHRKDGVVISNSRGESVLITTDDTDTVAKVAMLLAAESKLSTDGNSGGEGSPGGHEGSGHGRTP